MTFFKVLPPSRFFLSQTFVTLLLIYQISYRLINNTRLILLDSSWRIIFHLLTVLQVITLYVQAAFRSKKYKNYERFNNDFFNDLKNFYLGEDHTIKKNLSFAISIKIKEYLHEKGKRMKQMTSTVTVYELAVCIHFVLQEITQLVFMLTYDFSLFATRV